jgi:Domain of unknown function (DUF4384)
MSHPTPLTWFRFHAGDLGLFAWLSFGAHRLRCAECRERCQREIAERLAFEGNGPVPRAPFAFRLALPVLAIAAGVLVWQLWPRRGGEQLALNDEPEGFRPKGASVFDVFVVRAEEEALLGPRCREGDALQARYTSSHSAQIMVVGVDPHGTARVLFPLDGETSQAITTGPNFVANSWVLDGEPGRERFVAFFSDAPLRAEDARRAALADKPQLPGATVVVRDCVKAAR